MSSPSAAVATVRELDTPSGTAQGAAFAWEGGQYCALHARRGVVGCGIYDIAVADEFGMAFALAKGSPEHPLREPEDLFEARIVAVSQAARDRGVCEGMTGLEALDRLT